MPRRTCAGTTSSGGPDPAWPSGGRRLSALLRRIDPATYRREPLVKGAGALHPLAVRMDVATRAGLDPNVGLDPVEMVLATFRCKHVAPRDTGLAIAPGLAAVPLDDDRRLAVLRALVGAAAPAAACAPALPFVVALAAGRRDRTWSTALSAASAAQSVAVVAGSALHPDDIDLLHLSTRLGARAARAARVVRGRWLPEVRVPADHRLVDERRPIYAELLAEGTDRFFEEPRTTCPLCNSPSIAMRLQTTDLLQRKPGAFRLDECGACGHIFQNPRLSLEGLDFYYRDFYDGLGEADTDGLFAVSDRAYRDRVRMIARHGRPKRWLDVGGGHGHFCLIAAEELPDTHFDGLDMSDSIDEAAARGWIEQAHRGMFPDVADDVRGAYDVVSMHHYLEHTRDPLAELDAAHTALAPDGLLLIEVPHIQSRFGGLLGRWWLPWFQPQHQHFLSVDNLRDALEARAFDVVDVEIGPAQQAVDLGGALWLLTQRLAPPPDLPWLAPPTRSAQGASCGDLGSRRHRCGARPRHRPGHPADHLGPRRLVERLPRRRPPPRLTPLAEHRHRLFPMRRPRSHREPFRHLQGTSAPKAMSKPAPLRASAHQEDAGPFEGVGHLEPSCVEGPHVQALQKRRDACLRLGAVAGEERVQGLVLSKDAAEDRVERLHDVCALGGGGGDLLGHRVARGRHESAGVGVERVGDVDEDLAGQRIAVVRDHVDRAGVQDGHDDDVTRRPCAERADGGSVADLVGERLSLGGVAAHELDGVAVLRRPGADGGGHVARADDADGGHDVCSLVSG